MMPISVIISSYNRAHLLCRAVDSAIAATSVEDEIIVVDDESTDETAVVLARYRGRIRYIRVSHRGAGATRNAGILAASKSLLAFLDSDDEWMPHKLAIQRSLMEARRDLVYCCSDFAVRLPSGEEQHNYLRQWWSKEHDWDSLLGGAMPFSSIAPLPSGIADFPVYIGNFYLAEMKESCICSITLLVQKNLVRPDELRFAEDLPTYEDWECAARISRAGPGAILRCETAWNYGHYGPRLTDANAFVRATARLLLLQRVWGTDSEFISAHQQEYDELCGTQRLIRARSFLRCGHTQEAQAELRQMRRAPILYRLASRIPAGMFPTRLLNAASAVKRRIPIRTDE